MIDELGANFFRVFSALWGEGGVASMTLRALSVEIRGMRFVLREHHRWILHSLVALALAVSDEGEQGHLFQCP